VDRCLDLVKSVLPIHLEEFLRGNPSWKSADTLAEVTKTVKVAFSWGHKMGITHPSPFTGKVSYGFQNSRRPINDQKFKTLIESCTAKQQRLREVLTFCYRTGARPCEVRSMRWADLDLEQGTVTLREHKTAKLQRQKKDRVVYLDTQVIEMLIAIRQRDGDREYIFTSHRGRPYQRNSLAQNLKRLRRKAKLPEDCTLYGSRHAFATRAILNGCDVITLAELIGHAQGSRITAHYVHVAGENQHLRRALELVNSSGT
jgi:integrase